jgi:AraC-like DNA-binding protein
MVRSTGYAWAQYVPHPALANLVSAYWTLQTGDGQHVLRTLPDGCIDLTLRLGRPPGAFLAGAQRRACRWTLEGRVHLVGARLLPGTAALLGVDPRTLSDSWTPLDQLLPKPAVAALVRAAARARSTPARVVVLDAFLSERLFNRALDPRLSRALRQIFELEGNVAVAPLAKRAGAHPRTLGRLFRRAVGLTPKRFMRVVRLQAALRALPGVTNWGRVAADLGYHDQAHFIHDVRDLFGVRPGELVALQECTR